MSPKHVLLHNQYPEEVIHQLQPFQDPQVMHAYDMVETGQVYPLNEEELSAVRLQLKASIGEDVSDYPILVGLRTYPSRSSQHLLNSRTS